MSANALRRWQNRIKGYSLQKFFWAMLLAIFVGGIPLGLIDQHVLGLSPRPERDSAVAKEELAARLKPFAPIVRILVAPGPRFFAWSVHVGLRPVIEAVALIVIPLWLLDGLTRGRRRWLGILLSGLVFGLAHHAESPQWLLSSWYWGSILAYSYAVWRQRSQSAWSGFAFVWLLHLTCLNLGFTLVFAVGRAWLAAMLCGLVLFIIVRLVRDWSGRWEVQTRESHPLPPEPSADEGETAGDRADQEKWQSALSESVATQGYDGPIRIIEDFIDANPESRYLPEAETRLRELKEIRRRAVGALAQALRVAVTILLVLLLSIIIPMLPRRSMAAHEATQDSWEAPETPKAHVGLGHTGLVNRMLFSPDGRLLASQTVQGVVRLWDAGTGREVCASTGHGFPMGLMTFSPDSRFFAAWARHERRFRVWDLTRGARGRTFTVEDAGVDAVWFGSDTRELYASVLLKSGLGRYTLGGRKWDLRTGRKVRVRRFSWRCDRPTLHTHSRDGRLVAAARGRGVEVTDADTGETVQEFEGRDKKWVGGVGISPNGRLVAAARNDHTVDVWNVETGQQVAALTGHRQWVDMLAFSPDGRLLVTRGMAIPAKEKREAVGFWHVESRREIFTFAEEKKSVGTIALSPDGRFLVVSGRFAFEAPEEAGKQDAAPPAPVLAEEWTKLSALGPAKANTIVWYDLGTGRPVRESKPRLTAVSAVAFGPNGQLLASATRNGVQVWETANGRLRRKLQRARPSSALSLAFSPNGRLLASGMADGTVELWDVQTGHARKTLSGLGNPVWCVSLSPDGRLLGTVAAPGERAPGQAKLWDVEKGREVRVLTGECSRLAFSPDGRLVAGGASHDSEGDDKSRLLRLWDVATGEEIRGLRYKSGADRLLSIAFSPDGQLLASAMSCGHEECVRHRHPRLLKLWNVATGRPIRTLIGHTMAVRSAAFSPDGRLLATGSTDRTLKLWSIHELPKLWPWRALAHMDRRTLTGHIGSIRSVTFSPSGRLLASGSEDGTVKLWNSENGSLLATLAVVGDADDYVSWTPEGYFVATPSAEEEITVRIGARALPLGEYRDVFCRPDFVADKLAGKSVPPVSRDAVSRPQPAQGVKALEE